MRIIAGKWRGRALAAPVGETTRPSSVRLRQAAFDMIVHAPWGGRDVIEGASVLDGFAGTGAMGLEALSRGAASVVFIEQDRAALAVLGQNIAACGAGAAARVLAGDFFKLRPLLASSLVFLDPPYGGDLVTRALAHLVAAGGIAAGGLIVAETGRVEFVNTSCLLLAERAHGAGRLSFLRLV